MITYRYGKLVQVYCFEVEVWLLNELKRAAQKNNGGVWYQCMKTKGVQLNCRASNCSIFPNTKTSLTVTCCYGDCPDVAGTFVEAKISASFGTCVTGCGWSEYTDGNESSTQSKKFLIGTPQSFANKVSLTVNWVSNTTLFFNALLVVECRSGESEFTVGRK